MKRTIMFILLLTLLISTLFPISAFAEETEDIIRVGWTPREGINEVHDGVYSGYTYDLLMEISKYTGWQYEFVVSDTPTAMENLENGKIDLLGSLLYSAERDKLYDYSQFPSGHNYTVLLVPDGSSISAYDFDNFNGLRIACMGVDSTSKSNLAEFAKVNGFSYTLKEFDDTAAYNSSVKDGEADACVVSNYAPVAGLNIVAQFSPCPYYFATTQGNTEVLQELNRAMSKLNMDNPFLEHELYDKYLESEFNTTLTQGELNAVAASVGNPVVVGIVDNTAPISFLNEETGAYEGIAVDMLNTVSKKTGLRFNFIPVNVSSNESIDALTKDSPQLVLGVTKMENVPDTRGWYLSDSIISGSLAVVGRQGRNLSAEQGKKTVAIMSNFSIAIDYAKLYMPDFEIVTYSTLQDCLNAVASGKADAGIYLHSCISYMLQKPCYGALEIIPTYSDSLDICVAGFTSETNTYISIINKGLHLISEKESRNITLDYTVNNPYKLTLGDMVYKYRGPIIVISSLIVCAIALLSALYINKKESNKKVQSALEKAKQASYAKGTFMSRMSHEIRTPLNTVIGYNTIARNEMSEAKTDEERRQAEMAVMDCLTKSDIASRQLLTIINDVLDMSAIETGNIKVFNERFDFKNLISSLISVFYSQAKAKGVDFDVQFDTQMDEWIVGDQMRVNQILTNLLSNSIKFTPEGGKVTLFVRPSTEQHVVRMHFEVKDTGIGMSKEYTERIWQPFEQADSSITQRFGGTGLGLSITKSLVDLLGGTISVESTEGEGTTFFIDLTFTRTEQPEDTGPYNFSTINALIVDDDVSTCDYIRLLLTRSGVRSSAVYSGEDAINTVKSAIDDNDPYTVCLIDWRMPKMDGLETVKHIRNIAGPDLPIIVITAYNLSEIADTAAKVGVNMFISKPLFQSSLFNLLSDISGSPIPKSDDKPAAYNFSGARVLLAEDNAMNMEIARRIMSSANLTVDTVWNGKEAFNLFLSAPKGTYSAILMDIQMPVMDGYQATHEIRNSKHPEAKSIPIIAMTADAFAENVAKSFAAGMNDHISKPIDLPTLFKTLKKYIH